MEMSLIDQQDVISSSLYNTALKMMNAARTAPKARGRDNLVIQTAEKDIIKRISDKMLEIYSNRKAGEFFYRDANNILNAELIVLIGTRISPAGLDHCGLCGFANCAEKLKVQNTPCAFNTGDLGIAIGSAVSVAMDDRIDNRVMFSVGVAVRELELLGEDVKIVYGIPLAATGKNPFFDR